MKNILIISFLVAVLAESCGGKGKATEAGEPGNMGMEFLSDTAVAPNLELTGENAKNTPVEAWEGLYYPVYELLDGGKAKDSSLVISFKRASDGSGIYREAQLFGDRRKDFFTFQGTGEQVAVSVKHPGWTYFLVDDSTLKDNSGNFFKK